MNPLDNLKDIHAPSSIEIWPPAYGWWLCAILMLIIICCVTVWALKSYKIRAGKRQALQELALITNDNKNGKAQLNQLLKRVAMSYFPNANVQQMHGENWITFLTISLNKKHNKQFVEDITSLQQSLYQQASPDNFELYKQNTSNWINTALPPKKSTLEQLEQEHA